MARYRCTVCNWVYDEEKEGVKFADQPDSYTCPNCGAPKSAFIPEGIIKGEVTIATTVADKIVDQLVDLGVNYIYGIPGDSNLPLMEAIRKDGRIRFILTRHEETAAFMASAHGKMTDELGVCISIAGPGSTNLITGLMDAQADMSPVLAFIGQVPEVYLGSEAFQEIDQLELFHSFAEFSETIARPNQALKLTLMAAKYAYRKPGVSVLSTPTDILSEKLGEEIFNVEKRIFHGYPTTRDEEILKVVKLLNKSSNIAILTGWGARHYGDLLLKLAKKMKAPIATTSRAKGVISETSKYSLGVLGSIGTKHAAWTIEAARLILVIGTGFRHANLIPKGVKVIQIDLDPTRIGRTFNIDVGIVGDAGVVMGKLINEVDEREENKEFWAYIKKLKEEHLKELELEAKDKSYPINPGYVIQSLRRNVKKDAIICVDVGDHTYWFYKKFISEGQKIFLSANIASMGFALPASLSAKLDYSDRQVICLTGDGGFAMLASDFTTAVREKLAIKVVVFNDGKLKNIMKEQARDGYPEFGVNFPNPNFAEFALTCGGEGFRVENPTELDAVLKKAFNSNKPSLVEVIVDPEKVAPSGKKID